MQPHILIVSSTDKYFDEDSQRFSQRVRVEEVWSFSTSIEGIDLISQWKSKRDEFKAFWEYLEHIGGTLIEFAEIVI